MQAGVRDVVGLPLSLEQLEVERARRRRVVARPARPRGRRGGRRRRARRPAGRRRGRQGRRRDDDVALHLALAAARSAPGRPICVVDFDLQKGDFRDAAGHARTGAAWSTSSRSPASSRCATSRRRSTRTSSACASCSRPTTASAPRRSTRRSRAASSTAVKARHALTVVDLGATVSEASAAGAEMASKLLDRHHARRARAARRAPAARPLEPPAGARGRRGRLRRAQPRVAPARDPARPRAQGDRRAHGGDHAPGRLPGASRRR